MKTLLAPLLIALTPFTAFSADWTVETGPGRSDVVKNELVTGNAWLSADIRRHKYDKMAVSEFTFYRGSASLYYRDLAQQQLIQATPYNNSDAVTWVQGDMHLQNFGAFDNDKGTVVFDLNDFDEAWVASYLYDVWRAAASVVLVARENGFGNGDAKDFIDAFGESYLDTVESFRGNNNEKAFEITQSNAYGKLDEFLTDSENTNSRVKMLDKWTVSGAGARSFMSHTQNPNLDGVSTDQYSQIKNAVESYYFALTSSLAGDQDYFQVLDIAKRLDAGTGSLGTPRFYVLIRGASDSLDDARILDVKQQGLPAIYGTLGSAEQTRVTSYTSEMGCRVALANKALLNNADDHLGCVSIFDQSFSVRERSPYKESFDLSILDSTTRFTKLAEQYGALLAAAHARADKDFNPDLVPSDFESVLRDLTDGQHSEFRSELKDIAIHYADQVSTDYALFLQLRNSGDLN